MGAGCKIGNPDCASARRIEWCAPSSGVWSGPGNGPATRRVSRRTDTILSRYLRLLNDAGIENSDEFFELRAPERLPPGREHRAVYFARSTRRIRRTTWCTASGFRPRINRERSAWRRLCFRTGTRPSPAQRAVQRAWRSSASRRCASAFRITITACRAELERADYAVSANIGRTIDATRQAVIDVRSCADWLESQGYERIGWSGPALVPATRILRARTTPASR